MRIEMRQTVVPLLRDKKMIKMNNAETGVAIASQYIYFLCDKCAGR